MAEPFNEATPDRDDCPDISGSEGHDCECDGCDDYGDSDA